MTPFNSKDSICIKCYAMNNLIMSDVIQNVSQNI